VFTTPTKPHAEFADFVESGFGDYVSLPHPGYANIFPPALRQRDDRSERETKEMRFMEIPSNTFRCSARRWPFKAHRWLADSVEMQHTDISQNTVYWLNLTCQGCGTRERTASLRVAEILASTLFTLSDDAKRGLGIAVPEVDLATAEIVRHPETGDQHLVPLERNEEYGWFMRWLYKERDFTTPLRWACRPLTAPIALVRGYMERVKREPFNWLGGPLLVLGMAGILPAVLGTAAYLRNPPPACDRPRACARDRGRVGGFLDEPHALPHQRGHRERRVRQHVRRRPLASAAGADQARSGAGGFAPAQGRSGSRVGDRRASAPGVRGVGSPRRADR
jgi:hypothetical protein